MGLCAVVVVVMVVVCPPVTMVVVMVWGVVMRWVVAPVVVVMVVVMAIGLAELAVQFFLHVATTVAIEMLLQHVMVAVALLTDAGRTLGRSDMLATTAVSATLIAE